LKLVDFVTNVRGDVNSTMHQRFVALSRATGSPP
jgi:hypothetical protein